MGNKLSTNGGLIWKLAFTVGSYPKNISAVKKGKTKKVQVTEQPKDVISL